jgi:hypothetical protein
MQGGKLIISRGIQAGAAARPQGEAGQRPRPRLVRAEDSAPLRPVPARPEAAPDYHLIRERLDALERLSLLHDIGVLTPEEFAVEKERVLRLPAEEMVPADDSILPPRGPSLLGRLLGWKLLAAGTLAGLAFTAYTAPQDLAGLADRVSRLIG